ncbi:MAG: MBL fold metallo-hydrolase [Clostridiales bacterium]|nr:MBL fold metallo-hydrolase [Clostridiales bacterium]
MNLSICSLASGSSGNCYVVGCDSGFVLVDAGISGRQIREGLANIGLSMEDIKAVFVTHDHGDHVKGLPALLKGSDALIFVNESTLEALSFNVAKERRRLFSTGESISLPGLEVATFQTSHDAKDPAGFSFITAGKRLAIVTDTGLVTKEIRDHMSKADMLVLESNHDENILKMGRYPWFLKQRILGDFGHLSNEAAAYALADVLEEDRENGKTREKIVLLAHLSEDNNFPEMAMATITNILEERGLLGSHLHIRILGRSEQSPVFYL